VQRRLGLGEARAGRPQRRRGQRQHQLVEQRLVADHADELPHHAEPAGARDDAGVHRQVARDHPQQRGLTRAVGADQCHLGALAHPERDVREQLPAVRQHVCDPGDVYVTHAQMVHRTGVRRRLNSGRR
jgi:hypothetical protein